MKSRITINPVVLPHSRKLDGTYNVKIRLTYKRASRILPTQLTALPTDVTKSKPVHLKSNSTVMLRAQEITKEMYAIVAELDYTTLDYMDVGMIAEYVDKALSRADAPFRLDFFAFAEEYMKGMNPRTAGTYQNALVAFRRFLHQETLEINQITGITIKEFVDFLRAEPKVYHPAKAPYRNQRQVPKRLKKANTIALYTKRLKSIYKAAQDLYNDEDAGVINIPRNPFKNTPPMKYAPQHPTVEVEVIQRMISFNEECPVEMRRALDYFIISFGLMGINLADMSEIQPPEDGILTYERRKVRERRLDRALIKVKVDDRLLPYIERNLDADGETWLNVRSFAKTDPIPSWKVNNYLTAWAQRCDIERFTFTAARHSFASIARNVCKIDPKTVDECLDHAGNMKLADVYIKKDFGLLWEANKTVLDLFDWPGSGD